VGPMGRGASRARALSHWMGNQGLWFNESSRIGIRRSRPLDKWVGGRDQEPRGFNGSDQLWAPPLMPAMVKLL
jgi:hypothetical protein